MNYILLQTIISSVKSLTKGTLIIAGYISLIIFGFNINGFLFYENLSFIMALCLLLLFLIMFLFYPGIKSFISHHKKVAQEKYDSLSNHEKLTKF